MINRGKSFGDEAKQGVIMVRTRVRRGGLRKGKFHMKRKGAEKLRPSLKARGNIGK